MPGHEYFQELASVAALGELSAAEAAELTSHLRECANSRALHRIAWQERGLRMNLIEKFDDGKRLDEHFAGIELERRDAHLRVDAAVFGAPLLAAFPEEVNGHDLIAQSLEVERDANPVRGGRAKIGIQLQHWPVED